MQTPTLNPFTLLDRALHHAPKVYLPLIVVWSIEGLITIALQQSYGFPSFLFFLIQFFASPIFFGISFILVDQSFKNNSYSIYESFEDLLSKFFYLELGVFIRLVLIFFGTLFFILPGIYMGLGFFFYLNSLLTIRSAQLRKAPRMPDFIDGVTHFCVGKSNILFAFRYSCFLVSRHIVSIVMGHCALALVFVIVMLSEAVVLAFMIVLGGLNEAAVALISQTTVYFTIYMMIPIYIIWNQLLFRSLERI